MSNMMMFEVLVPFILMFIWTVFSVSSNLMVSLLSLLTLSLILPMMWMEEFKIFWPCSILLILISTGLMVVFSYIVSLHSWLAHYNINLVPCLILSLLSITFFKSKDFLMNKSILFQGFIMSSSILLSCVLVGLLLLLVVIFIRLVYSKGGGFRKKF